MKTSFFLKPILFVGTILFLFSCQKLSESSIGPEDNSDQMTIKSSGASCSVSCFWSSCYVSNCAGTATCVCLDVWYGFLGTTATCNCSHGTPRRINLTSQNILHHETLQTILANISGSDANDASQASKDLLEAFDNDPDDMEELEFLLNRFVNAMNNLTETNMNAIRSAWVTCSTCEAL